MSYLQTVTYTKSDNKSYTEEVIASTPENAKSGIERRLGETINVTRTLTSVPSVVPGAPPNV
tara:strand:- start:228 stop:413 length:186 start_codon:yes stop_codon:yes gene_type:complete